MVSTSASEPVPQRIGDAERDAAAGYLRDHLAAGRLDPVEFDERLSRALTAKTAADLEPLFADLPAPRPSGDVSAVSSPFGPVAAAAPAAPAAAGLAPTSERASKVLGILSGVAWPLVIMLCFVIGWQYWWLIFLPIALSSIAGSLSPKPVKERTELEQ